MYTPVSNLQARAVVVSIPKSEDMKGMTGERYRWGDYLQPKLQCAYYRGWWYRPTLLSPFFEPYNHLFPSPCAVCAFDCYFYIYSPQIISGQITSKHKSAITYIGCPLTLMYLTLPSPPGTILRALRILELENWERKNIKYKKDMQIIQFFKLYRSFLSTSSILIIRYFALFPGFSFLIIVRMSKMRWPLQWLFLIQPRVLHFSST